MRTRRQSPTSGWAPATSIAVPLLLALTAPLPAVASDGWDDVEAGEEGELDGHISQRQSILDEASEAASQAASGTDASIIWVAQPILASHPDGDNEGLCRGWQWVAAQSEDEATQLRNDGRNDYNFLWASLINHEVPGAHPDVDCPIDPADAVPAVTIRDTVRALVTDQLPRPTLSVPPGYAMTGMPAYLVTGDEHDLIYNTGRQVDIEGFLFDIDISASGVSTVDWGDGSEPVTYTQPGRPYPDGEVHHTYRDRGDVDITVTDEWEIVFTATTATGTTLTDTVTTTLATTTLDDLEVQEYRAVRVNPDS